MSGPWSSFTVWVSPHLIVVWFYYSGWYQAYLVTAEPQASFQVLWLWYNGHRRNKHSDAPWSLLKVPEALWALRSSAQILHISDFSSITSQACWTLKCFQLFDTRSDFNQKAKNRSCYCPKLENIYGIGHTHIWSFILDLASLKRWFNSACVAFLICFVLLSKGNSWAVDKEQKCIGLQFWRLEIQYTCDVPNTLHLGLSSQHMTFDGYSQTRHVLQLSASPNLRIHSSSPMGKHSLLLTCSSQSTEF